MSETNQNIPPKLQEIIEDFQWSEGQEKLELLLQYAEEMPPLPEGLQTELDEWDLISGCMTPVYVHSETQDGKMRFFFDVPRESPTVRGYASLIAQGLNDATPAQVLNVPNDFYMEMGLHQVLTSQRVNGMAAILAHMKRLAVEQIEA